MPIVSFGFIFKRKDPTNSERGKEKGKKEKKKSQTTEAGDCSSGQS